MMDDGIAISPWPTPDTTSARWSTWVDHETCQQMRGGARPALPLFDGTTEAAAAEQAGRLWPSTAEPEQAEPRRPDIQSLDEFIRDAFQRMIAEPPIPEKYLVRPTASVLEALVRADQYNCDLRGRFAGPLLLTRAQYEQLMGGVGNFPDDWDERAQVGAVIGMVLDVPVGLVATLEESTPWAFGWRSSNPHDHHSVNRDQSSE